MMEMYVKQVQDLRCGACGKDLGRIVLERVYDPNWGHEADRPYTTRELAELLEQASHGEALPAEQVFEHVRERAKNHIPANNAHVRCNVCRNEGRDATNHTFHIPMAFWDIIPEPCASQASGQDRE